MNLQDNPVYQKYNGKTIKIEGKILFIQIANFNLPRPQVRMTLKYTRSMDEEYWEAKSGMKDYNEASFEVGVTYDSRYATSLFMKAREKCDEILDELEEADMADITEETA